MPELITVCSDCMDQITPDEWADHTLGGECANTFDPFPELRVLPDGTLVSGAWQPPLDTVGN